MLKSLSVQLFFSSQALEALEQFSSATSTTTTTSTRNGPVWFFAWGDMLQTLFIDIWHLLFAAACRSTTSYSCSFTVDQTDGCLASAMRKYASQRLRDRTLPGTAAPCPASASPWWWHSIASVLTISPISCFCGIRTAATGMQSNLPSSQLVLSISNILSFYLLPFASAYLNEHVEKSNVLHDFIWRWC